MTKVSFLIEENLYMYPKGVACDRDTLPIAPLGACLVSFLAGIVRMMDGRNFKSAQVMHAVGIAHTRLTFDSAISLALPANDIYFQLAEACMLTDPEERPSFGDMHLVSLLPSSELSAS